MVCEVSPGCAWKMWGGGLSNLYLWLPPGGSESGQHSHSAGASVGPPERGLGDRGLGTPALTGTIFFGTGHHEAFLSYSHCLPHDQKAFLE